MRSRWKVVSVERVADLVICSVKLVSVNFHIF